MPDNQKKNPSKNQSKDRSKDQSKDRSQPAPNDQRANVKNPNDPAFDADRANRQRQGQDGPDRAPSASVPQPDAAPDKHK